MTTMLVTYSGTKDARFDREYYRSHHLPLVTRLWGPHGLSGVSAFFPEEDTHRAKEHVGVRAGCLCTFQNDDALRSALTSSETPDVMNDLQHFTDMAAVQHVLRRFDADENTSPDSNRDAR